MAYRAADSMVGGVYGEGTGKVDPFGAIPVGDNQVFFVFPLRYVGYPVLKGKGYRWVECSPVWLEIIIQADSIGIGWRCRW